MKRKKCEEECCDDESDECDNADKEEEKCWNKELGQNPTSPTHLPKPTNLVSWSDLGLEEM